MHIQQELRLEKPGKLHELGSVYEAILNAVIIIQLGIKVILLRQQRLFSVLLSYAPKFLSQWGNIDTQ